MQNKNILSMTASCSQLTHLLSDCTQNVVETPVSTWPNNIGSKVVRYTCSCGHVIYTQVIR